MPNTTQGPNTQPNTQDRVGSLLKRMTLAQIGLESLDNLDDGAQQTLLSTHRLAEKISSANTRLSARALTLDPLRGLPNFLHTIQERSLPLAVDTAFGNTHQASGPRSPSDVGPWQDWINAVYLMLFDEDEDADEAGAKKPQYTRQQVRQAVAQRVAAQPAPSPTLPLAAQPSRSPARAEQPSSLQALLSRLPAPSLTAPTTQRRGFLGASDQERASLFQYTQQPATLRALDAAASFTTTTDAAASDRADLSDGISGAGRASLASTPRAGSLLPGAFGVRALGASAQHLSRVNINALKMASTSPTTLSAIKALRPLAVQGANPTQAPQSSGVGSSSVGFKLSSLFESMGEGTLNIAQWVESTTATRDGYRAAEVSGSLLALLPEQDVERAYQQVASPAKANASTSARLQLQQQEAARQQRAEQLQLEHARIERLRLEQLRAEHIKVATPAQAAQAPSAQADLIARLRQLTQSPTAAGQRMQWLADAPTARILATTQPTASLANTRALIAQSASLANTYALSAPSQAVESAPSNMIARALQRAQAQATREQQARLTQTSAAATSAAPSLTSATQATARAQNPAAFALLGDVGVSARYLPSLTRSLDAVAQTEGRHQRFASDATAHQTLSARGARFEASDAAPYQRAMFEQGTLLQGVEVEAPDTTPAAPKSRQRAAEAGLPSQAIEALRKMGISAVSLSEVLPGLSEVIAQQRLLSERALAAQTPTIQTQSGGLSQQASRVTLSAPSQAGVADAGLHTALQRALATALEAHKNPTLSQPEARAAFRPDGLTAEALKALPGGASSLAALLRGGVDSPSTLSSLRLLAAEPSQLMRNVERLKDQVFIGQVAVDKAYVSALGASLELVSAVDGRADRFDDARASSANTTRAPEAIMARANQMLSIVHAPDLSQAQAQARATDISRATTLATPQTTSAHPLSALAAASERDAARAEDATLPVPLMKAMERLGVKVMRLSDVVPGLSELVRQEKAQALDGGSLSAQRHLKALQQQAERALQQTPSATLTATDAQTRATVQALIQQVTQLKQTMHIGDMGRVHGIERAVSKLAAELVQSGGRPEVAAELSRTLSTLTALRAAEGDTQQQPSAAKAEGGRTLASIERLQAVLSDRAIAASRLTDRVSPQRAAAADGAGELVALKTSIGTQDQVSIGTQRAATSSSLTLRHSLGAHMELITRRDASPSQQVSLDVKRSGYSALEPVTERFVPSLMAQAQNTTQSRAASRAEAATTPRLAEFGIPETGELIRVRYSPDTLEAIIEAKQKQGVTQAATSSGRAPFDAVLRQALAQGATSPQGIAQALERTLPGLVMQPLAAAQDGGVSRQAAGEQRRAAEVMRRVGLRLHQAQLESQRAQSAAYLNVSSDWERAWVNVFAPKVTPAMGAAVAATSSQQVAKSATGRAADVALSSASDRTQALRLDTPDLNFVSLTPQAQAMQGVMAAQGVKGGQGAQVGKAEAQVSALQGRLGQLSGWSGLSGALSEVMSAKVKSARAEGAGLAERALVRAEQRASVRPTVATAQAGEQLARSLKQAEAVQLSLGAEVGQLFSMGSGLMAQQQGARFDDTQMLSRIERLLDQAQAVGDQRERAVLSQSDMLVLRLGPSGQGKQDEARDQGLPTWRKKAEHVQGVEVGELREMLQKVGALPVQGGKVSADRQLVNPFVAVQQRPYDVEAHSPLFSGGDGGAAGGSSGESAASSAGSPLAPSMPSYDQLVKLSDRVYKFIMKKLRQDLNRY